MFWGLYSNTLEVEASTSKTYSFNTVFSPSSMGSKISGGTVTGGSGYINNGTGSISSIAGGTISSIVGESYSYHVTVPFIYNESWTSLGASSNSYYDNANKYFTMFIDLLNINSSSGTVSNVCLYNNGRLVKTLGLSGGNTPVFYHRGSDMQSGDSDKYNLSFTLEYDVSYVDYWTSGGGIVPETWTSNINVSVGVWSRLSTSDEIESATIQVADNAANQSLDAIEQSSQEIATSVTSDTGGGLLATIKNFFGGFFSNLINSILGLFVPDSTYFSTWFDNLNTLLSAKLGMLYAPFDLLISTLNAVYSADTTEPGITFPGITWDGETVIEPYTFYFSSLGEDFQNLRDAVYFATDVVFLFAFLHLLQKKIALVITGSEVNG